MTGVYGRLEFLGWGTRVYIDEEKALHQRRFFRGFG